MHEVATFSVYLILHFNGIAISFAAEIAMFENNIVVYKFVQDLHFFVTGGEEENELILATVLQGFFDAVGLLLRYLSILLFFASLWCNLDVLASKFF